MQFQLFFDYDAIVNSCSFTRKYDVIFRAVDKVYRSPDHPAFGRQGYRKSAYLKALIYKQCEQIKYVADLIRDPACGFAGYACSKPESLEHNGMMAQMPQQTFGAASVSEGGGPPAPGTTPPAAAHGVKFLTIFAGAGG